MKNLDVLDNPYYIDYQNASFFPEISRKINYYTLKTIALLCGNDNINPEVIKSNWRKFTLPDNVYYSYSKNGSYKYNEYVGQKLEIFLNALDKPENRKALQESYFYVAIRQFLVGKGQDATNWGDYTLKDKCDQTLKGKNSVSGALLCYRNCTTDTNNDFLDFGFNFDLLFDKILKQNSKGEWIIKDSTNPIDRKQIDDAMNKFIHMLKQNKQFNENYEEDENRIENE